MPPVGRAWTLAAILVFVPLTGCASNMGEFKESLGFGPEPEPEPPTPTPEPEPTPLPPFARARANASLVFTNSPITFTSDGSYDPDGVITTYAWEFGDGASANGRTVDHSYARAGEYLVNLTVMDRTNLSHEDQITVRVKEPNKPPTATFDVRDATGLPVTSGDVGEPLHLNAEKSKDPEGANVTFAWTFGDGKSSEESKPSISYERAGAYKVKLTVTDPEGLNATVTRTIKQNTNYSWSSQSFSPGAADGTKAVYPVYVPAGLRELNATFSYSPDFGTTHLELQIVDALGNVVVKHDTAPEPGSTSTVTATLTVTAATLATKAEGDWSVVVVKRAGFTPTFGATASVQY